NRADVAILEVALAYLAIPRGDRYRGVAGDEEGPLLVQQLRSGRDGFDPKGADDLAVHPDLPRSIDFDRPTVHDHGTGLRQEEVSVRVDDSPFIVQAEAPAAREPLAGRRGDDEEAVAANSEIEGGARLLERTVPEIGAGIRHGPHPIAKHPRENPLGLEAGGIHVREVVRDDLLAALPVAHRTGRLPHPVDRTAHALLPSE